MARAPQPFAAGEAVSPLLDGMRAIVERKIPAGERLQTSIPFLALLRVEEATKLEATFLQPSLCVVVQGRKKIFFGSEPVVYGPGDYVVSTLEMTTGAQVLSATRTAPYLGVRIAVSATEIASILVESKLDLPLLHQARSGAFVGTADHDLLEAVTRLLRLIDKPNDAAFLAGSVKREIIYRLLAGENGPRLYRSLVQDQQFLGVARAVEFLKQNFVHGADVETMARSVEMSVSSLRHKFKAVTGESILQYQKRLRLEAARRLLLSGTVDVATSAYRVGYESQSQFSREYTRLFGAPPVKDLRNSRSPGAVQD
ncbi:AraC family transcriptional regulator [Faunimonas pinastri]|nr:AraC family transcriptional regulator [Faunimonas pinastri]